MYLHVHVQVRIFLVVKYFRLAQVDENILTRTFHAIETLYMERDRERTKILLREIF